MHGLTLFYHGGDTYSAEDFLKKARSVISHAQTPTECASAEQTRKAKLRYAILWLKTMSYLSEFYYRSCPTNHTSIIAMPTARLTKWLHT